MKPSGVFLTFSGNCKEALTLYQNCFGGILHFNYLEQKPEGYMHNPVVLGRLESNIINIFGSDLVQDEGRVLGNTIALFIICKNKKEKLRFIKALGFEDNAKNENEVVEFMDMFGVRWMFMNAKFVNEIVAQDV